MLTDRLAEDMKTAMKARDPLRVAVLRMTLSEIKNARIEKGEDLSDEDVLAVIRTAAKRRDEAVEQYRLGKREDLAKKEASEGELLRSYLPARLEDAAVEALVDEAIRATGAGSIQDLGRVIKHIMSEHRDRVDGKAVQALVRSRLAGQG